MTDESKAEIMPNETEQEEVAETLRFYCDIDGRDYEVKNVDWANLTAFGVKRMVVNHFKSVRTIHESQLVVMTENGIVLRHDAQLNPGMNPLRVERKLTREEQEKRQYQYLKEGMHLRSCVEKGDKKHLDLFLKYVRKEGDDELLETMRIVVRQLFHDGPGDGGFMGMIETLTGRDFVMDMVKIESKTRNSDALLEALCGHMVRDGTDKSFEFWSPLVGSRRLFARAIPENAPQYQVQFMVDFLTSNYDSFVTQEAVNYRFIRFLCHCLENGPIRRLVRRKNVDTWRHCRLPRVLFDEEESISEWQCSFGVHLLKLFYELCGLTDEDLLWHLQHIPGLFLDLVNKDGKWVEELIVKETQGQQILKTEFVVRNLFVIDHGAWFDVVDKLQRIHHLSRNQIYVIFDCVQDWLDLLFKEQIEWGSEAGNRMKMITTWLQTRAFQSAGGERGLRNFGKIPEKFVRSKSGTGLFTVLAESYLSRQEVLFILESHGDDLFGHLWQNTNIFVTMLERESRVQRSTFLPITRFVFSRIRIIGQSSLNQMEQSMASFSKEQLKILSECLSVVVRQELERDGPSASHVIEFLKGRKVKSAVNEFGRCWSWGKICVKNGAAFLEWSGSQQSLFLYLLAHYVPLVRAADELRRIWDAVMGHRHGHRVVLELIRREKSSKSQHIVQTIAPKLMNMRSDGQFLSDVIENANESQLRDLMYCAWTRWNSMVFYDGDLSSLPNVVACVRHEKTHRVGREYFCESELPREMLLNANFAPFLAAFVTSYMIGADHCYHWNTLLSEEVIENLASNDRHFLFEILRVAPLRPHQMDALRGLNERRGQMNLPFSFWTEFDQQFGYLLLSESIKDFGEQKASFEEDEDGDTMVVDGYLSVPLSEWTSAEFSQWVLATKWPKKLEGVMSEIVNGYSDELHRGEVKVIGYELDSNIENWEYYHKLSSNSMLLKRFVSELKKVRAQLPSKSIVLSNLQNEVMDLAERKEEPVLTENESPNNQSSWWYTGLSWVPGFSSTQSRNVPSSTRMQLNSGPVGLRNLGSTCFMNSGLQCSLQIPWLIPYLLKEDGYDTKGGRNGQLFRAFLQLAKETHHVDSSNKSFSGSVSRYHDALAQCNSLYTSFRQLDAFESVQILLDSLHNTLNVAKQPNGPVIESHNFECRLAQSEISDINRLSALLAQRYRQYEEATQQRDHSVVTEMIQGSSVLFEHCLEESCHETVCSFETWKYVDLTLEDVDIRGMTFEDILRWTNEPRLVERFCTCGGRKAHEYRSFYRAPPVLFVRVRRFSRSGTNKISDVLEYPEEMTVNLFHGKSDYELRSVCLHQGGRISGGHYVAEVKSLINGKWYFASDSTVYEQGSFSRPRGQEVMLVYARKVNSQPQMG